MAEEERKKQETEKKTEEKETHPVEAGSKKEETVETPKSEEKIETKNSEDKPEEKKPEEKKEEKIETTEKPKEDKKEKHKPKKTEAVVNARSLPISTKHATFISKFIKNKSIEKATNYLESVINKKTAVPMKGEIPHRKGKIMSGRYPKNASEYFIKLLKTLSANSNVAGINNPVIVEVIANMASRPYSRFGRIRRKRTHVRIVAKEKKVQKNKKEKENAVIKDSDKIVLKQEVKNP